MDDRGPAKCKVTSADLARMMKSLDDEIVTIFSMNPAFRSCCPTNNRMEKIRNKISNSAKRYETSKNQISVVNEKRIRRGEKNFFCAKVNKPAKTGGHYRKDYCRQYQVVMCVLFAR